MRIVSPSATIVAVDVGEMGALGVVLELAAGEPRGAGEARRGRAAGRGGVEGEPAAQPAARRGQDRVGDARSSAPVARRSSAPAVESGAVPVTARRVDAGGQPRIDAGGVAGEVQRREQRGRRQRAGRAAPHADAGGGDADACPWAPPACRSSRASTAALPSAARVGREGLGEVGGEVARRGGEVERRRDAAGEIERRAARWRAAAGRGASPSPKLIRTGASRRTGSSCQSTASALTATCFAAASSSAAPVIRASAPARLVRPEASRMASASCGPFTSIRALPPMPLAAMPSSVAWALTAGFGGRVGDARGDAGAADAAAGDADIARLEPDVRILREIDVAVDAAGDTAWPMTGRRSSSRVMRSWRWPVGRVAPGARVKRPSACRLRQSARVISAVMLPSAARAACTASESGAPAKLPCGGHVAGRGAGQAGEADAGGDRRARARRGRRDRP